MNQVSERFQTNSLDRRLHKTTPKCNPWIVTISIQRNKSAEYVYLWQNTCLFSPWRSKWQIKFIFAFRWQDKTPIYWGKYWSLMKSLFDYITYKFSLPERPHPPTPRKKMLVSLPLPKRLLVHLHNSGYFFLHNIVLKERNKGLRKISTQQRVSVKNVNAKPS